MSDPVTDSERLMSDPVTDSELSGKWVTLLLTVNSVVKWVTLLLTVRG